MAARRLPNRGPQREVAFTIDGRRMAAVEGEPVAASLLVAGRTTLSRSFRFHRPRGLMCSTGQCGWCECEVNGVPSVRTCRVPARDGLVLRSEHALPTADRDVLGVLERVSRLVPPTFYHHRFIRPKALRKAYLNVLRWFGGRGRLPVADEPWNSTRELRRASMDVLVVGCGPSGLAAARAARATGARVTVLEAEEPPSWDHPGAAGAEPDMDLRSGTPAVGWYDGVVAAIDATAVWQLEAPAIVVATGTYERVPMVPGADRPGVMSARLATRLIERFGILPGQRPALVGAPADLDHLERLLRGAGAVPAGTFADASVVRIQGRSRVTGLRVRDGGGERVVRADLVIFSARTPSLDLLAAAGAATRFADGRFVPVVDHDGRTSVPGLFAVGGAADRSGRLDDAARTGAAAAMDAAGKTANSRPGLAPAPAGIGTSAAPSTVPPGALACFCEDVHVREIHAEVAAGYGDPELLKRRTGALTGPCQGKYCLTAVAAAGGNGDGWVIPTTRPPLRPVRLGDLAGPHPLAPPGDPVSPLGPSREH